MTCLDRRLPDAEGHVTLDESHLTIYVLQVTSGDLQRAPERGT
jgi:hypothetical protein